MCAFSYVLRDGVWHESKLYSCLQKRGQKLSLYNFSIFYSSLTKLIFMLIWKFNHFVNSFLKHRFHNEFNCGSVRFGVWCNELSFRCESTGKDILEIRNFNSATIRSCLFYSNFPYRFYYCSVFYEVGVFSIGLRGVNILFFAPLLHSWLRASKPQAMNKIISAIDRLFMAVSGLSWCGKTELTFKMLLHNTFSAKFNSIF